MESRRDRAAVTTEPCNTAATTLPGKGRCVMAVTNDMLTDQRVRRAATTLVEAGWTVTVVGRSLQPAGSPQYRRADACEPFAVSRMRLLFRRKAFFYAEYNLRLLLRLLRMPVDLIYSNDTDTLPACYLAARLRRKRLFFDAHEMFPEVPELVGRKAVKRVWEAIEARLFPRLTACCTVSQSIADAYAERYGVKMSVVRNLPPRRHDAADAGPEGGSERRERVLLYQGAVNVGRGVDWLIDALEWLPQCRLVVAGDGDELQLMIAKAALKPYKDRIEFLGRMLPGDLAAVTRRADLGVCLLKRRGLSYYYALPNRVGDFVQARVPLLMTDFPELRRVAERYGIGTLVPEDCTEPRRLAQAVADALRHWDAMPADERRQLFDRAGEELCWESERPRLLTAVDSATTPIVRQS